jgi:two-component system, cell cycle sensor histidine kinase and response regulator CckA
MGTRTGAGQRDAALDGACPQTETCGGTASKRDEIVGQAIEHQSTLRILLVDDDEDDYVWIRRVLASEDGVQVDWAASYEEGCTAIQAHAHDVILVDYRLRDHEGRDGLDVVRQAREEQAGTPCILFTGVPRLGLEIASLSAGAAGFLTKSEVSQSRLMHAILQAVERGKTETELFRKNRALSLILRATEAANEALVVSHAFEACLRDVCTELGWEVSDALLVSELGELSLLTLHADDEAQKGMLAELRARQLPKPNLGLVAQVLRTRQAAFCRDLATCEDPAHRDLVHAGLRCGLLVPVVARDGIMAILELYSASSREAEASETEILAAIAGQLAQTVVRARAEEESKRAEAELRQSQRLDALGRLAGGVAHDFNNLLTVITVSAEMLLGVSRAERTDDLIETMLDAAQRGARLTRQLLALGRKNVVTPRIVDVNTLIRNNESLLRRTLRENIDLRLELSAGVGCIEIDPNEFEQLLLNLVLNARDAIEGGGELTIATELCMRGGCGQLVTTQPCVCLDVRDTGVGMAPETLEHIFDPFFTTKESGKGTGLGLSCVYSIVRQAGGAIDVRSEPGAGTWFRLSFPLQAAAPTAQRSNAVSGAVVGGSETILLVEDNDAVRASAALVLESFGYRVLVASRPHEALAIARQVSQIDLVLSDVVMPEMSGVELAGQLTKLHPGTPVQFMSGYAQVAVEQQGLVDVAGRLLAKPFTARELARQVRIALDDAVHIPKPEGDAATH